MWPAFPATDKGPVKLDSDAAATSKVILASAAFRIPVMTTTAVILGVILVPLYLGACLCMRYLGLGPVLAGQRGFRCLRVHADACRVL